MALDLGLTTYQLLSALDDVALDIRARSQRLDAVTDRAFKVSSDKAAARTGPEGLLGSCPPPDVPQDWTALPPHQPGRLRHHLRSEPWLPAVQRADPGRGR